MSEPSLVKTSKLVCGDCYFLTHDLAKYGEVKPCNERRLTVKEGVQKEDSPICEFFKTTSLNFRSNVAPSVETQLSHIIESEFQSCRDALVVGKSYEDYIRTEGLDVPFDSREFLEIVSKLSDLRTVHQLINLMGLAQYTEQIMTAEIAKLYKIPIASLPVPVLNRKLTIPDLKKKKKKNKKKKSIKDTEDRHVEHGAIVGEKPKKKKKSRKSS